MIKVQSLHVQIGAFALEDVSFSITPGSYAALMGKTGSGKTTLLEAICGLRRVRRGTIELNGQDVTNEKPAVRGIGLVPQDGALFSTHTVEAHLAFALRIRRWDSADQERRVHELAELLQLSHLLPRRPAGLSGGERQRVALGRALSFHPNILCLDEPLSALDDETRSDMMKLLKRVQKETGVTVLHVTHNRGEAEQLADRFINIDAGRLQTS